MNYTKNDVSKDIKKVMKMLNIDRLPTVTEIRNSSIKGLSTRIDRTGGLKKYSKEMNLPLKKPILKWTDKDIKNEIHKIMKTLNLTRMPTRSEVGKINPPLTSAITRSGGWYLWGNKLGLETKRSETTLGKGYEFICEKDILEHTKLEVKQMPQNYPFDLLVGDFVKVDVKAGNRYYYDDKNYYHTFNLEKKYGTCDLYICYCLNNDEVEKILIMPSSLCKLTQLSLGVKSRYDVFKNRWEYFDIYNNFYKNIKAQGERTMERTCEYCAYYGDKATYPNTGYCSLGQDYVNADDCCIDWNDEEYGD